MIVKENDVYDYYNKNMKSDGICGTITSAYGGTTTCGAFYVIEYEEPFVIQKCGDRDKDGSYSVHDYSNCIPAHPMSDRRQLLVEYDKW